MSTTETAPEKQRIRVFRCPKCAAGYVTPTAIDGRFFRHRDIVINLPMDVYLPRCSACQRDIIQEGSDLEKLVVFRLEEEYRRHEAMIKAALERLVRRRGNN